VGHLGEARVLRDAGIVDQYRDRAVAPADALHDPRARVEVGDVGGLRGERVALAFAIGQPRGDVVVARRVQRHDRESVVGESLAEGLPQAPGAARDEGEALVVAHRSTPSQWRPAWSHGPFPAG